MPWTFIIPSVLLAAGCVATIVFSKRENYRLLLKNINASAKDITDLTRAHLDIYERLYALIFFFGNDSSIEKQTFALDQSCDIQDIFDLNILIDLEISSLLEKAEASEKLVSERSVSLKNLTEEIEEYEKNFAPAVMLFNQRIEEAHSKTRFNLTKKILSNLGACTYSPIVFPR